MCYWDAEEHVGETPEKRAACPLDSAALQRGPIGPGRGPDTVLLPFAIYHQRPRLVPEPVGPNFPLAQPSEGFPGSGIRRTP